MDINDPYEMRIQDMEAEARDNDPHFISKGEQAYNRKFLAAFNFTKKRPATKITVTELPGDGREKLVTAPFRPQHLTWIPF